MDFDEILQSLKFAMSIGTILTVVTIVALVFLKIGLGTWVLTIWFGWCITVFVFSYVKETLFN